MSKTLFSIGKWLTIGKYTPIELGHGYAHQYILFECKYLGSLLYYNLQTEQQDRYHSHAFNSLNIVLSGGYNELVLDTDTGYAQMRSRKPGIFYQTRDCIHRLMTAKPGTRIITITGPWDKFWFEYHETKFRIMTWGRKKIRFQKGV